MLYNNSKLTEIIENNHEFVEFSLFTGTFALINT